MKFTELQRILGLTPGNLSSHLRKLKEAGYVKVRKTFILELRTTTIIEITREGVEKLLEFTKSLRAILRFLYSKIGSTGIHNVAETHDAGGGKTVNPQK